MRTVMKARTKLFFAGIIIAISLCSCSSNETVELDAWKDKLKNTTQTQTIDNPLPGLKEDIDSATDKLGDAAASGQNKAQAIGNLIVDKVKDWAETPSDLPLHTYNTGTGEVTQNTENSEDLTELIDSASGTDLRIHVTFKRVVDGDTIVVERNGEELPRIRLIGINTPESVHPDESKNVAEGKFASDYLKEYMKDVKDLWLEIGIETHDDYGRLLAYVWLSETSSDDDKMLNIHMVQSGWAEPMTIEPNSKYKDRIEAAAEYCSQGEYSP